MRGAACHLVGLGGHLDVSPTRPLHRAGKLARPWIVPTIFVVAISAVLHGLYDTCLKKEMNGFALLVAILSFAYLALLLSRLQTGDDQVANEEMLAEYKRRRAAMR